MPPMSRPSKFGMVAVLEKVQKDEDDDIDTEIVTLEKELKGLSLQEEELTKQQHKLVVGKKWALAKVDNATLIKELMTINFVQQEMAKNDGDDEVVEIEEMAEDGGDEDEVVG